MQTDTWARCGRGHSHWGRYGAAGLLAFHRDGTEVHLLLQQRAWWGSGGGTWCLFGGGRHRDEDPLHTALRETREECTLDTSSVDLLGVLTDDHGGGWAFTTVVASVPAMPVVQPASMETRRARWVPVDEVGGMRLFEPFAAQWPNLKDIMSRLVLVVDAANVVGSRADGWWRDRAGATARLRDELAGLAETGVTGLPEGLPAYDRSFPEVVLVVEGAAKAMAHEAVEGVRIVAAPHSGDDAIVDLVSAPEPGDTYLVVTADRELKARSVAAGAVTIGPRWLLDQLSPRAPRGPRG